VAKGHYIADDQQVFMDDNASPRARGVGVPWVSPTLGMPYPGYLLPWVCRTLGMPYPPPYPLPRVRGGYVADEKNLSQDGDAWVYGDAQAQAQAQGREAL
jgi:hypothetical protein